MQDCAQGMWACSNRTCQFPSFPPSNPGIGGIRHTTDRCITAIKPCSKSINEMTSFIGVPGLPSLQQVTTGLLHLFAFDVEKAREGEACGIIDIRKYNITFTLLAILEYQAPNTRTNRYHQ